ncbi:MAG: hypothetical protein L3J05_07655 [Robiginitomaculum sp.]|nr:hypothetical protein [Robiginitomaculum sp.]
MSGLFSRFLLLLAGSLLLAFSVPAQINEDGNSWDRYKFRLTILGMKSPTPEQEHRYRGEGLVTTSKNEPGLLFICLDGKFRVSATVKAQNLRHNYSKPPRRVSRRLVDMTLDGGEKIPLGTWSYAKNTKILRNGKRTTAAKLYNAAVRGQDVVLYIEGNKPIILDLPKPNSDFANFGAKCGIGKLAKKK